MVNHLEPDTLEREVQWALGSITRNKTSGGDGIPAELFLMLSKCCTLYVSKFGKLNRGHRTRKGQFPFQYQRRDCPKKGNAKELIGKLGLQNHCRW